MDEQVQVEQPVRGRGRPRTGNAKSGAARQAEYAMRKKALREQEQRREWSRQYALAALLVGLLESGNDAWLAYYRACKRNPKLMATVEGFIADQDDRLAERLRDLPDAHFPDGWDTPKWVKSLAPKDPDSIEDD